MRWLFDLLLVGLFVVTAFFGLRAYLGEGGARPEPAESGAGRIPDVSANAAPSAGTTSAQDSAKPPAPPVTDALPAWRLRSPTRSEPGAVSRAKIAVSVQHGVAPLPIFFDALESSLAHGTKHDAHYEWRIRGPLDGEPTLARHEGGLFCFAHVFEVPGRYEVTLTIRERRAGGAAVASTDRMTVEVAPFSGRTYYVAADGDDGASGRSPETAWKTWGFALDTISQSNRRVLFRRGDVFRAALPTQARVRGDTNRPIVIGAFGSGAAPRIESHAEESLLQFEDELSSWRITDLHFVGRGKNGNAVDCNRVRDFLLLRVEAEQFGEAFSAGQTNTSDAGPIYVFGCRFHDTEAIQCGISARRIAVVDTTMERDRTSHVLRLYNTKRCVLYRSSFLDPSLNGPNGRHALKLHNEAGDGSEDIVVAQCTFRGSTWPVTIAPQDEGSTPDRIRHVIFERNTVDCAVVHPTNPPCNLAVIVVARDVTIRNNLFIGPKSGDPGTDWDAVAIDVYPDLKIPGSSGIRVQHNTAHVALGADDGSRYSLVRVSEDAVPTLEDLWVENNVMLGVGARHSGSACLVLPADRGRVTTAVVERGNVVAFPGIEGATWTWYGGDDEASLAAWAKTAPAWRGAFSIRGRDPKFTDPAKGVFSLRPDSPAIGIAVQSPGIWIDHTGRFRPRPGAIDAGAFQTDG